MSNTSRIARQRIIYTVTPREPVGLLYLYLELCEASFWILYCFTIHIDTGINTTCFKSDLCSHQSLTYHMKSPSSRKVVIVNSVAGESPNFSIQGFDQGLEAGCCSTEIQHTKWPYQLDSPKPLTRPFVLKYVKLLGSANQVSLPSPQAPWGVTHE